MLNRIVTSGRGLVPLRRRALGMVAVAALLPMAACNLDEALQVEDQFSVTPGVARDTANLINTYAGALTRFQTAVGGRQNSEGGFVLQTATFTDEAVSSDNFSTRNALDRRVPSENNAATAYPYIYLQRARAEATNAASLFASTSKAGSQMHVNLHNVIGYSILMLAEAFCSGVPLSNVDVDGAFQASPGLETNALLDSAIANFDRATSLAGSNFAAEVNLARVGKARAQMLRGDYAAAAATVAPVPSNFVYQVEFDAATQVTWNAVNQLLNQEKRWSTTDNEGTNGLNFMSAHDPRVPWGDEDGTLYAPAGDGPALDGGTHFSQLKYPDVGDDIELASGVEARYIQAEAALKAGNVGSALTFVNQARAAENLGLGALVAADFGATAKDQARRLFRERAFSLWLEGKRMGDIRRMIRHFGFTEDEVLPIGLDRRGDPYGDAVVWEIPQDERNNPLYTGCLTPATQA